MRNPFDRPLTYILDEEHRPQPCEDQIAWSKWFQTSDAQRIVRQEDLPGGRWLSTVFLGLDHSFSSDGPPELFETRLFGPDHTDLRCERWSTWDEALVGHERVKQEVLGDAAKEAMGE